MAVARRWSNGNTSPLTFEQRAALRHGIDAAVREALHRRRHTHLMCPGCGGIVHRSDYRPADRLCVHCWALGTGGGV
jgi:hypothetical protein